MSVATLQTSLQRLRLYLGKIDNDPGPLTADALACALSLNPPPRTGASLFAAIPAAWWADHPNRVAMLYAQINAETAFQLRSENLNYDAAGLCKTWPTRFRRATDPVDTRANADTLAHDPTMIAARVYEGRMGNCNPGDGWRFRGRSWAQLTGRDEYVALSVVTDLDLVGQPDLANDVMNAGHIAVAYAVMGKGFLAAADRGDVSTCRHLWNGGNIGLQTAVDSFDKVRLLWGNP